MSNQYDIIYIVREEVIISGGYGFHCLSLEEISNPMLH